MDERDLDEARLCTLAGTLGQCCAAGDILLLAGPMGAGKTTFTRALAIGLGISRVDRVRSPTFNLAVRHEGRVPLLHVDLFRMIETGGEELPADSPRGSSASVGAAAFEALGLAELVDGPRSCVVAIEWSELWRDPPADHLRIALAFERDAARSGDAALDRRRLSAHATGPRHAARLAAWAARWRSQPVP
jgi:tRNA threonylcarbamoyladenosine biosynthesis protein TsaE